MEISDVLRTLHDHNKLKEIKVFTIQGVRTPYLAIRKLTDHRWEVVCFDSENCARIARGEACIKTELNLDDHLSREIHVY